MEKKKLPNNLPCQEYPQDCMFRLVEMKKGETSTNIDKTKHYLIFSLKGKVKVVSNLFAEEEFVADNILFLPRQTDSWFEIEEDAQAIVHNFSHASCDFARCILSNLYMYDQKITDNVPFKCKYMLFPHLFHTTKVYLRT